MTRIRLRTDWMLDADDGQPASLRDVIDLLTAIERHKNLRRACRDVGLSYRHAWGLVRHVSRMLGAPLLRSVRGQGTTLSVLGERIAWANKRAAARLGPLLESLESELEAEMRQAVATPNPAVRIDASHAFAMDTLRDHMREKRVPIELRYRGSAEGLASLCHGTCDISGFHTPIGNLEPRVLEYFGRWLKPRAHVLVSFVTRRQGIIVATGNPKRIASLSDLVQPGLRFVNRQHGSGTRLLFDLLLARYGIACRQIKGFDNVEFTHAAVAACIASGMGDAGLGVEAAARLFRLGFVPLLQERYFLVCHEDAVESRLVKPVLDVLRSQEFKARLSAFPGIDASACGTLVAVTDAYPELAERRARAKRFAPIVETR